MDARDHAIIPFAKEERLTRARACAACDGVLTDHVLAFDAEGRVVAMRRPSTDHTLIFDAEGQVACEALLPRDRTGVTFKWTAWIDVVDGSRSKLCFAHREGQHPLMVGSVDVPPGATGTMAYVAYRNDYGGCMGEFYRGTLRACKEAVEEWGRER